MKIKILTFLFLITVLSSCKEYLDVNNDPFVPQEGPPHLYMPQIIYAMAEGPMFDYRFVSRYIQHLQFTAANDNYDRHGRRALGGGLAASQTHRNHYWSIGSNLNQVALQAERRGFGQYKGITMAIRAYSWQIATDQFGEMPYDQAWDNTRTKFDYNTQKEIYANIDRLCDDAIAELGKTSGTIDPNLARVETIFGGNIQLWIKFVFAIKARLANHISNKRSYNPAKVIEFVDKSLAANAEDAAVRFSTLATDLADRFSFMGPTRANFGAYRHGRTLTNMMNGTVFNNVVDPRLTLFANASTDGTFRSLAPSAGLPAGTTLLTFPQVYGRYIFRDTEPYPLITYSELQFIKAEAALKAGNNMLAYQAFTAGIRANMQKAGVTEANITTFLSTAVPQTPATLEIRHIMSQKYIALYGQIEAWADLRRYNYDSNVFVGYTMPTNFLPENSGKAVQRCLPPSFSEEDWNSAAFRAVGGYDLDYHTKPLWFTTTEE